ncbi:MAG: hypothetical protein K5745_02615 [Saccharofermentans sp.]|nr:hypothetical protein [Saccharofermentans sp.]
MKIKYCEEYKLLRLISLKEELAKMPLVKCGTMRERPVVRIYKKKTSKTVTSSVLSITTTKGKEYYKIAQRREQIIKEIKSLDKHFAGKNKNFSIRLSRCDLDEEFWNKSRNGKNPIPKPNNYYHHGIQMRSRSEMLIAEILDELGLEYKYEPAINFGGITYYPDFLVYLPGLKRCIIIEFFGKCSTEEYVFDMASKIKAYSRGGLLMNRDFIGFYGTEDNMNSGDYIYNCIVMVINLLAAEALV